jgi:hypothetical protein
MLGSGEIMYPLICWIKVPEVKLGGKCVNTQVKSKYVRSVNSRNQVLAPTLLKVSLPTKIKLESQNP